MLFESTKGPHREYSTAVMFWLDLFFRTANLRTINVSVVLFEWSPSNQKNTGGGFDSL